MAIKRSTLPSTLNLVKKRAGAIYAHAYISRFFIYRSYKISPKGRRKICSKKFLQKMSKEDIFDVGPTNIGPEPLKLFFQFCYATEMPKLGIFN